MSAEIDELKRQLGILMKERDERPEKVDPVRNAVQGVQDHLTVLSSMYPTHDLSDLVKRAENLGELNTDVTGAFNYALSRWLAKNGPVSHDFAYVRELGEEVHQAALDKKAENQTPAFDVKADEDENPETKDED